jgi:hypothetical protein
VRRRSGVILVKDGERTVEDDLRPVEFHIEIGR